MGVAATLPELSEWTLGFYDDPHNISPNSTWGILQIVTRCFLQIALDVR